jgi:hypothetical protein
MSRPLLTLLACAAALLASCSTVRLSYDHADFLLARMAARYVDLDEEQSRAFRAQLSDFHAWHRAQELPHYAALFDDAARRLGHGLSQDDLDWVMRAMRERAHAMGSQAGEDLAPVLATLSDKQVRQMEERFEQDNRKFMRTQLNGSTDRRARWIAGRVEDFVGELTPAQMARVRTLVEAFPDMPALRLAERKRRQQVLVRVVRDGRRTGQLERGLAQLLANPDAGRPETSRQAMHRWQQAFFATMLELDRSLSPEQRHTAVVRLRAYASDFRHLARAAPRETIAAIAP